MIKMYICLHIKYQLFLSDFNETRVFSTNFGKMLKYQIWNVLNIWVSC